MKIGYYTAIFGRSGSGKNVLLKNLLYHEYERFDHYLIFDADSDYNNCKDYDYLSHNPNVTIHANVESFMADVDKLSSFQEQTVADGNDVKLCIIMDNIFGKLDLKKDTRLKELFTSGRKKNIFCILLLQNMNELISGIVRASLSHVYMVSKLDTGSNDNLYSLSKYDTKKEFVQGINSISTELNNRKYLDLKKRKLIPYNILQYHLHVT